METDSTTQPPDGSGKRRARHQRRRNHWRQRWALNQQRLRRERSPFRQPAWQARPMWQEPLRGALYAAGGSAIALLTPWVQHWLQHWMM